MVNYLSAIRNRTLNKPVRLRLGGNSMDSSTYVPDQPDIVEFTNPNANSNDQPVNYGPALFDVMNAVNDKIGGTEYLIGNDYKRKLLSLLTDPHVLGLSLRQPNSTNIPLLAGDAQNALGDTLDAFLLGNVSRIILFCSLPRHIYIAHRNRICIQDMVNGRTRTTIQWTIIRL